MASEEILLQDSAFNIRLNATTYFSKNFDATQPLFADTETNYLYKGIRLVQLYQAHWDSVVVFDVRDVKLSSIYAAIKGAHIVFHNICYDAACFQEDLNINVCPFGSFDDTLLLARQAFAYNLEYFSLDRCFEYIYGYDVYAEIGEKKAMQKSFLSTKKKDMGIEDLTDQQIKYAAADVFYMPKFWDSIKHIKNEQCYKTDVLFIKNLLRWQRFGMPIDKAAIERLKAEQTKLVEELTLKLPQGLNVNSPKQVKDFLGFETSDKTTLLKASEGESNEACDLIIKKRKALKMLNFLDRYSFERVRGFFSPTTISGRVRCDGSGDIEGTDNLLQIPRALKGVFGFGENDERRLVYCDFAQLELRTACCNTSERNIEKAFREGLDLHAHTAALMFEGLSYEQALHDKEKRTAAKMCNFSLLYCSSAKTFKNAYLNNGGGLLTDEQASTYRNLWKSTYNGFAAWHEQAVRKYQKGLLECKSKNGRRYKAKMFTDICGVENQSIGADAAKTALNIFLEKEPNAKVLCFIHDAIIVEAQNDNEAKRLAEILGNSMVAGWFKAIENLPINDLPMPLEVGVGPMLYEAESNTVWATQGLKSQHVEIKPLFEECEVISNDVPEEVKNRDILFDADTPFYISALEAEGDLEVGKDLVLNYFKFFREQMQPKSVKYYLTIGRCFRYDLCDTYKANRDRDKAPPILKALKFWAAKKFSNIFYDERLEADDLVFYNALENPNALICSIDKDVLNSLPGRHWNPMKRKIVEVSHLTSTQWPYMQCIMGDSSDNVKGAKGIGEKKLWRFLDKSCSKPLDLWLQVLEAYRFAGQTIDEAVLNMQLVRLDQFNGKEVELWQPLH